MAKLYFEDVQEGQELPQIKKTPDLQQIVLWAAAAGDFVPLHFDADAWKPAGLPGFILHGAFKYALLGRLVFEWTGDMRAVKRLDAQFRGMDLAGDEMTCKGIVTKKREEGGQNLVELEVWTENPQGVRTTPGTATVSLPSRGA